MTTQRRIASIASCGLLLVSMAATRFVVAGAHVPPSARSNDDACALLTAADATPALEQPSLAGKRYMESNPKMCVWSHDPEGRDSSRRIVLVIVNTRQFQIASRPAMATIKVEPVSGVGDEAFYQIYPKNESPLIWVRKGNAAFTIRILTQLKPKPFTIDQEKAKEVVLAKAAVARF